MLQKLFFVPPPYESWPLVPVERVENYRFQTIGGRCLCTLRVGIKVFF